MTFPRQMDFQELLAQRRAHPAWRLLLADHAPMIASFLHQSFIVLSVRGIAREQLASQLDDHLFNLHETAGETLFPKASAAYLDDWASDNRAWLRKYYPVGKDEPHYDITPAAELALGWMEQLQGRPFVGAESRLATVYSLLQQIADGTELNPRTRIAALRQRKADIDAEIKRIEQGRLELMEPAAIRERFLLASAMARSLLADGRAMERNFRKLDSSLREKSATGEHQAGMAAHLEDDPIAGTDEVASFRAFHATLMSPDRRDQLAALLEKAMALAPVRELRPDPRLRRLHHDLLESAQATQQTFAHLATQLRRYLESQAGLANRRIMQLIRGIEQKAVALRGQVAEPEFAEIDEPSPALGLPMDRTLYKPPFKPRIVQRAVSAHDEPFPVDALFRETAVDHLRLASNVRHALATRSQVSLGDLAAEYPIEHGLAELAAYLKLATDDLRCAIDEERTEVVRWLDANGQQRQATLPLVVYTL